MISLERKLPCDSHVCVSLALGISPCSMVSIVNGLYSDESIGFCSLTSLSFNSSEEETAALSPLPNTSCLFAENVDSEGTS